MNTGIGSVLLFIILLMFVIMFFFAILLEFIKPTTVQIHLLGIHLTLFGGFLLLRDLETISVLIMIIGLIIGLFASFRNKLKVKKEI